MTRPLSRAPLCALLILLAAPLSGCGIKGSLDRPPPLWGDVDAAEMPDETTAAESIDDMNDPVDLPDRSDEDLDDIGYGIDIAD